MACRIRRVCFRRGRGARGFASAWTPWAGGAAAVLAAAVMGVTPAPAGVVITEIYPRPAGGEGEWIEVLNTGAAPVELAGWSVHDATGRARLLPGDAVLGRGVYAVLAARPDSVRSWFGLADSAAVWRPDGWPTLNDRDGSGGAPADVIVLVDPGGVIADSVAYYESWLPPEKGRSLERVAPDQPGADAGSWGWTQDPRGGTPAARNTLRAPEGGDHGALRGPAVVEPATTPGVFEYRVPGPGTVAIWLVSRDGDEVAVLLSARPVSSIGTWVWSAGAPRPQRPGPYFVCLRWQGDHDTRRVCRPVWVRL